MEADIGIEHAEQSNNHAHEADGADAVSWLVKSWLAIEGEGDLQATGHEDEGDADLLKEWYLHGSQHPDG